MTVKTATIIPFDPEVGNSDKPQEPTVPDDAGNGTVIEKLNDAMSPGYQAEFDPAEAEAAGAFQEDALSEADALASSYDTLHFLVPDTPGKE